MTGLDKDAARSLRLEDLFSGDGAGGLERLTQALDHGPASSTRARDTSSGGRAGRTCRST